QGTLHAGVTDDNLHVVPQRHVTVDKIAAIEEERVVFASQRGNELVHDAARNAYKLVLSLAREFDQINRIHIEVEKVFPECGRAHFHRRRGAEARFSRDVAAKYDVSPSQPMAILLEVFRDPADKIAPGILAILLDILKIEFDRTVEIDGMHSDKPIGPLTASESDAPVN